MGNERRRPQEVALIAMGIFAVVAVILGYQVYRERQKTTGVEISIGERGISIEKK